MICPHCKKPIDNGIPKDVYKRALKLVKEGYSTRDVSKILFSEGHNISFASISRAVNGQIKKVKP